MQRRISVPQKGIEAQKLFTEFLGFFIAYDRVDFRTLPGVVAQLRALGPLYGSLPAAVLQLPEKLTKRSRFIMENKQNKGGGLNKSLKLIFVYTVATGSIFTFVNYWDSVFYGYCGSGTFLAFALMTVAILPVALVYSELASLFHTSRRRADL